MMSILFVYILSIPSFFFLRLFHNFVATNRNDKCSLIWAIGLSLFPVFNTVGSASLGMLAISEILKQDLFSRNPIVRGYVALNRKFMNED